MKPTQIFAAAAIAALLAPPVIMPPPAQAQIIEEDEVYSTAAKGDFFGRISASGSSGGSVTSSFAGLSVGYDTSFAQERGRFYFNAIGSESDIKVESRLTDDALARARRNGDEEAVNNELITLDIKESSARVDDAFVQYDIFDNFEVTAGRRRVNWGQFELLSPVSLSLPLSISNTEAVNDKVSTLFAQDQAAFSWYPTERMEVSAYHFFTTNLDPLFETILENQHETERFRVKESAANAAADDSIESHDLPRPAEVDLTDNAHSAARVVYYGNWGTIGFTYHDGFNTLGQDTKNATLQCLDSSGSGMTVESIAGCGSFNRTIMRNEMPVPQTGVQYFQQISDVQLYESKNYGFELAIPRGDWVWKFELSYAESMTDLRATNVGLVTTGEGMKEDAARLEYYKAIIEQNDGKLFMPVDRTLAAFGADTDGDNWRLNLVLAYFSRNYENDELIDLQDKAEGESELSGDLIFPVVNIARYMGGTKNKEMGFVGGFLGTYMGASLYYTSLVQEKFRWTVGLEAVSNLRDELAAETEQDGQGGNTYEIDNEINVGGRVSLSYSF